ncbi:hypothetical protein FGIG_01203 [Fasciola gigantica]|uniref:SH3 domain-containing protein n=1 Tax=Fasciola gigantica TaxID=46835 RepID=A0A504YMM5_FASGI|nr:hypothetical protein FGIG_01203 [Fasciola gigantica]
MSGRGVLHAADIENPKKVESAHAKSSSGNTAEDSSNEEDEHYATVLHDYTPFRSDEIQLRVGECVRVLSNDYRHSGGEGWWVGEEPNTGRIGVFPGTYVALLSHRKLIPLDDNKLPDTLHEFSSSNSFEQAVLVEHAKQQVEEKETHKQGIEEMDSENEKLDHSSNRTTPEMTNPTRDSIATEVSLASDSSEAPKVVLRKGIKNAVFQVKTIPSSEIVQKQVCVICWFLNLWCVSGHSLNFRLKNIPLFIFKTRILVGRFRRSYLRSVTITYIGKIISAEKVSLISS